jgi:hypothetical protein
MINSKPTPHESFRPIIATRSTQAAKLGERLGAARGVLLALVLGIAFWVSFALFVWA